MPKRPEDQNKEQAMLRTTRKPRFVPHNYNPRPLFRRAAKPNALAGTLFCKVWSKCGDHMPPAFRLGYLKLDQNGLVCAEDYNNWKQGQMTASNFELAMDSRFRALEQYVPEDWDFEVVLTAIRGTLSNHH